MNFQTVQINHEAQRRLKAEALQDGVLKVMPAAFYRQFEQADLSGFCVQHGLYCLPTEELLDQINQLILEASPTRQAIEIGSGNGVLGKGLGIPCTDNFMQQEPDIRALYAAARQGVVQYGTHVHKLEAHAAVAQFKPEVVVAAWVTHKWNAAEPEREGNMYGVDELEILRQIKRYVFVANLGVHGRKPLLDKPYRVINVDYLFSRAFDPQGNALLVWDRNC